MRLRADSLKSRGQNLRVRFLQNGAELAPFADWAALAARRQRVGNHLNIDSRFTLRKFSRRIAVPKVANAVPWLVVDGQQVHGQKFGNCSRFTVKSRPKNIVIGSDVTPPNNSDARTLGVPVLALLIDGGRGRRYIDMDEEVFPEGFYYVEKGEVGPWRWTNGSGRLDPVLWSELDTPFHLSVFVP